MRLAGSVPAGQCVIDFEAGRETRSLRGLIDYFYAYASRSMRNLAMASSSNPSYQVNELEVKVN